MLLISKQYLAPLITGNPADASKVKECEEKMKTTLSLIENVWLRDKPYLVANTITIADLLGVCEVEQLGKSVICILEFLVYCRYLCTIMCYIYIHSYACMCSSVQLLYIKSYPLDKQNFKNIVI